MTDNKDIGFLFDLDGVIIDSEKSYTGIWQKIEMSYPTGVTDFARRIKGTTLNNILNTYFPEKDHERIISELNRMEDEMIFEYCPGAETLIKSLSNHNVPMAIVTSSTMQKMNKLYRHIPELPRIINKLVSAENVEASKPDPEGYLKGAKAIEINPENCVVVEDSLQGVIAGKRAGAFVIGITGTIGAEPLRPHADILLDTLEDVDIESLITLIKERRSK